MAPVLYRAGVNSFLYNLSSLVRMFLTRRGSRFGGYVWSVYLPKYLALTIIRVGLPKTQFNFFTKENYHQRVDIKPIIMHIIKVVRRRYDVDLNIIEEQRENNVTILKLEGELDVYTSPKLKEKILTLIRAERPFVVLDLEGLSYMDSTGLGVMAAGLKRVRENGGNIVLVSPRKIIQKILEITNMDVSLKIYHSSEEAIAKLAI